MLHRTVFPAGLELSENLPWMVFEGRNLFCHGLCASSRDPSMRADRMACYAVLTLPRVRGSANDQRSWPMAAVHLPTTNLEEDDVDEQANVNRRELAWRQHRRYPSIRVRPHKAVDLRAISRNDEIWPCTMSTGTLHVQQTMAQGPHLLC